MRNRWEEKADDDLDAPASITERELRSLKRRAGFGVPAVLLSCVAVGGLGWALYAGPEGLERIQDVKERYIAGTAANSETTGTEAPAANIPVPVSDSAAAAAAAPAADSVGAAPGGAPPGSAETRRAATQGSQGH